MISRSESTMQLGAENLSGIVPGSQRTEIEAKLLETAGSRRQLRKLREQVLGNKDLQRAFGDRLPAQFDDLIDRVQTQSASRDFASKVEKRSWGKWALEKAKSVVLFPIRHPFITAAIALTALGAGYYYAGSWEALMAKVGLGKVHESIAAALQMAKPTLATPVEASGGLMEVVKPAADAVGPYTPPILDVQ